MVNPNAAVENTTTNSPGLLDQVRDKLRVKHYSIRTEQAYLDWIKRYIFFHDKRHLARRPEAGKTGSMNPTSCKTKRGKVKILQEVITLGVFIPFAVFYMQQPVKLDYLWAGLCLMGAVYFMFRAA